MSEYAYLQPFTETDKQRAILDALDMGLTQLQAADHVGCSVRLVGYHLRKLRMEAAQKNADPTFGAGPELPDPYVVTGTSTLFKDGKAQMTWVKAGRDQVKMGAALREAAAALREDLDPYQPTLFSDRAPVRDLANVHVITDYHLGMMAWGDESGEDWDLAKSERLLADWFDVALRQAPDAELGVLAQLGDFLHFDSLLPVTPTSGHVVDASARYQQMVRSAVKVLRRVIDAMLVKYPQVHVLQAEGNHDISSSVWLRELFAAVYADEPRVVIDTSPVPYYALEWGDTALFFHHGHKKKLVALGEVFAARFRPLFGRTKFAYGHTGHLHHIEVKENGLMVMEQHRTLSPNDAHGARGGYTSGRSAPVISYHKRYGEVARLTISPDMVSTGPGLL